MRGGREYKFGVVSASMVSSASLPGCLSGYTCLEKAVLLKLEVVQVKTLGCICLDHGISSDKIIITFDVRSFSHCGMK